MKDVVIITAATQSDHVHMLVSIANVQKQAGAIAADLERIEIESAEKATVARMKAEV